MDASGYDLEDRTLNFSKDVIRLLKGMGITSFNKNIVGQLLRCATSIGANYREANGASSKKDFKNRIHFCKKEAKETQYWIQLLAQTNEEKKEELRGLWKEAHELTLIFSKIVHTMNKKDN